MIDSSIGEVLDVDVAETGVQWGKCLRVRVKVDVTKKLVCGKKVTIEEGEGRWVQFKYERLPNFCYHCGILSHDLRDCTEVKANGGQPDLKTLQYGAWLRGELLWKFGREIAQTRSRGPLDRRTEHGNGRKGNLEVVARAGGDKKDMALQPKEGGVGIGAELESTLPVQGSNEEKEKTRGTDDGGQKKEGLHEIGKSSLIEEKLESTFPILGNAFQKENRARGVGREEMQWEMETKGEQALVFVFNMGPNKEDTTIERRLEKRDIDDGSIAMMFSDELGWTVESSGSISGHWKRIARENRAGPVSD